MEQENIESTLTLYETSIRELEASVSLCTICEMEKSYLNFDTIENQDSALSSFDLSNSSVDTTNTKSNIIQELPKKNCYPNTTIDSYQCEKFNNDNISSSSSTTFSDFLKKTTKEVCEKLSNSRWNDASWDTCAEDRLKKNIEYETVLSPDLFTDEINETQEISKNLVEIFRNNRNDINDDEENSKMEESLKINEISNNDGIIMRKRSNISLQARNIVDISNLKEFSERFMNNNSKTRKKKSKMFEEYFCVSSMTLPVEKRITNDSPKISSQSIFEEEIHENLKNVVEEIALTQKSHGIKKRSNKSEKSAQSVKEEIISAEEKSVEKIHLMLEDKLEEIPRKKPKIVADEIIISAIHIPLKPRYKYFPEQLKDIKTFGEDEDIFRGKTLTNFSIENQIVSKFKKSNIKVSTTEAINQTVEDQTKRQLINNNDSTKISQEVDVHLHENIKNSQTSSPINSLDIQHRIELQDAKKNYIFHNQSPFENEEILCDRVTIFSIEIPIASELKNMGHLQILSKKSIHPASDDDDEQGMLKDNIEEIATFTESNKNKGYSFDVQHAEDTKKNNLLDKLTPQKKEEMSSKDVEICSIEIPIAAELKKLSNIDIPMKERINQKTPQKKEEMSNKDVEFCSIEIPIAAELKKLSNIDIPINETINQNTEDDDQLNKLSDPTSTKNINESEELRKKNEENNESHYPDKLILNESNKYHEEANIVKEQNKKVPLEHDASTVRALRKKNYPIDIPHVKNVQKSWEAVKKEFVIPKNKRHRRYRPLTQKKSPSSQELEIIRDKTAKRRELLTSAINRLQKLSNYTTELRNIFRNDNSIAQQKKNMDDSRKKIFVSTGTQTIDFGLNPLNHCLVVPSINQSNKLDIKPHATFVYNPYHGQRDSKNEDTQNDISIIPSEVIVSGADRSNIGLSTAPMIIHQNNNRVIEPKVNNSLSTQKNPIEFQNESKIEEDIHSYNPLRPKRVLRKIRKLGLGRKSAILPHQPLIPNKIIQ